MNIKDLFVPKMFLEGVGKVREIFKADLQENIRRSLLFFAKLVVRKRQPLLYKPFLRRGVERFPEIPVEREILLPVSWAKF